MENISLKKWSEILTIVNGKNQKDVVNTNGPYPIYGSGGIIGRASEYLCDAGTTIIGRKGTINSPIFVNEKYWNVDTAFGLSPNDGLEPKYLFFFCQYFNFKDLDKSTTIPSLAKRDLLQIEMPYPPLEEQKRIVARIEELFSELDAAVATLERTKEQLAVYRQAVLKEAFSSLSVTDTLKNQTSLITSGSRGWAKYYSGTGAQFLRIGNLTHSGIDINFDEIQHLTLPESVEGKRSR